MKYVSLIVMVMLPHAFVSAQGLVTCTGGSDCNLCSLITMVNGIVEWLIIISVLLAVMVLAYAGILLIISAGDPSAMQKGKQLFINCIIGIMIMLASWTIVDTFLKLFTGSDFGVWNQIECGGAVDSAKAGQLE